MSDKELWLTVRRALLMIAKAIEAHYMAATQQDTPPDATSISDRIDNHR